MERYGVDDVRAFEMLKRLSQDSNTRLTDIAQQVIDTRSGHDGRGAKRGLRETSSTRTDCCWHVSDLFAVFFVGMIVSGAATYNEEAARARLAPNRLSVLQYLTTGDFVEATFENWESEFLQMGMYVVLTAFLYQKGSSESKPLNKSAPQDADPREAVKRNSPWPVRRGRMAAGRLRAFVGDRILRVVLRIVGIARIRWRQRVQRGAGPARAAGHLGLALRDHRLNSGSSPCRTGRASSSRSRQSSGCRSSCGSAALPNRSPSPIRTAKPAPD